MSLILISDSTEESYYEKEEVVCAIDLLRDKSNIHKVLPIYLNGRKDYSDVPYGLKRINGIYIENSENFESMIKDIDSIFRESKDILKSRGLSIRRRIKNKGTFPDIRSVVKTTTNKDLVHCYELEIYLQGIALESFNNWYSPVIIFFDIDKFTNINNLFGKECADEILKQIDNILYEICNHHYYDRIGGDEFVICIKDISEQNAIDIANSIKETIHSYKWSSIAPGLYVSASFGVSQLKFNREKSRNDLELLDLITNG